MDWNWSFLQDPMWYVFTLLWAAVVYLYFSRRDARKQGSLLRAKLEVVRVLADVLEDEAGLLKLGLKDEQRWHKETIEDRDTFARLRDEAEATAKGLLAQYNEAQSLLIAQKQAAIRASDAYHSEVRDLCECFVAMADVDDRAIKRLTEKLAESDEECVGLNDTLLAIDDALDRADLRIVWSCDNEGTIRKLTKSEKAEREEDAQRTPE